MKNTVKEMRLKADGITCAACAGDMETVLADKEGILEISVNFVEDNVVIRYDPGVLSRKDVYAAVRRLGYPLKIVAESDVD